MPGTLATVLNAPTPLIPVEPEKPLIAKVFQSGNSQAIRIPKELRTDEKEFIIRKSGGCYYLIPASDPWALIKQTLGSVNDEDLSFARNQPLTSEVRESLEPGE